MLEISRLLWSIAFGVAVVALVVLCDAMLPGPTRRAREIATTIPVRAFFVGLINLAFFSLICLALFSARGIAAVLGLALALAVLSLGTLGLTVTTRIVAARLHPETPETLRSLVSGAAVLVLASAVPFVGWFVVLPLALCIGSGATIIAFFRRRAATPTPPVTTTAPPVWSWPPQPPHSGGSTSGSG